MDKTAVKLYIFINIILSVIYLHSHLGLITNGSLKIQAEIKSQVFI